MFGLLFLLLARGQMFTKGQVDELRADRDRWRAMAETVVPNLAVMLDQGRTTVQLLTGLESRAARARTRARRKPPEEVAP